MMRENIKFNVIVPTRERADTLIHCLRTILSQNYDNFEVIVSDNFSQDNTKDVVDSFADSRIRYVNTGKRLSMSHNWEFALNQVKEGWVMFIGDDDGLFPWALETLNKLIKKHKVEALCASYDFFRWPGHFEDFPDGQLEVSLVDSVRVVSTRKELKRVFFSNVFESQLPWLYEGGAASIELINKARNKDGRFFCSQVPDLYSAVALSFATDKYLFVDAPIALIGVSKHSSGTSGMIGKNEKEKKAGMQFFSEDNIPFHASLIAGKSFQVIWYEVYLQSWHIHKGELGVTLANQLKVVERLPSSGILNDILKQCQAIAKKNNLPFNYKGAYLTVLIERYFVRMWKRLSKIKLDCREMRVVNVYDAIMASAHVYKFLKQNTFAARIYLFLNFIKHGLWKIKNTVLRFFLKKSV